MHNFAVNIKGVVGNITNKMAATSVHFYISLFIIFILFFFFCTNFYLASQARTLLFWNHNSLRHVSRIYDLTNIHIKCIKISYDISRIFKTLSIYSIFSFCLFFLLLKFLKLLLLLYIRWISSAWLVFRLFENTRIFHRKGILLFITSFIYGYSITYIHMYIYKTLYTYKYKHIEVI